MSEGCWWIQVPLEVVCQYVCTIKTAKQILPLSIPPFWFPQTLVLPAVYTIHSHCSAMATGSDRPFVPQDEPDCACNEIILYLSSSKIRLSISIAGGFMLFMTDVWVPTVTRVWSEIGGWQKEGVWEETSFGWAVTMISSPLFSDVHTQICQNTTGMGGISNCYKGSLCFTWSA